MNKLNYLTLLMLLILSTSLASAKVIDDGKSSKQLVEIFDCFNVTVKYSLTNGNSTPISFDGCSDKGSNTWFCDCKGYSNGFNLTMRTDRSILRDPREYDVSIDYVLYNFYSNSDDFEVEDWGDYVEVNGESIKYTNSSIKCKNSVDIIYINKTVEVIEYRNRTVEVEKNVTVYVENTSKVDILQGNLDSAFNEINTCNAKVVKEEKKANLISLVSLFLAVIIMFLTFKLLKVV